MRTSFISTMTLMNTPRYATTRMQADLATLSKEVTTSRLADVGLSLGAEAARSVTLHVNTDALAAFTSSNGTATARLQNTDAALGQMSDAANDFMNMLIASRDLNASDPTLQSQAASALDGFISTANSSDGSGYLFGGINSSVQPLADFDNGPQAAIVAAFTAKFGFPPDDPQVANIDAADMQDFLDNEFSDLFADPAWGTDWSSASDQTMQSRISQTETVTTSVSANQPAMRKLAMAYSMVAALGVGQLGMEARNVVIDQAIKVVGDAIPGITSLRADVGAAENRITDANNRLSVQQDILSTRIQNLEGVDPAEAKVKMDTLTTQIEMSYSLTARLSQLSILNYV